MPLEMIMLFSTYLFFPGFPCFSDFASTDIFLFTNVLLIVTHSHFIYPLLLHLSLNPGEPSLLFSPNPRHNESASSHSPLTLRHSSSPRTSRTSLSRRLFSPRHSDSRGEALDGELVPTTDRGRAACGIEQLMCAA